MKRVVFPLFDENEIVTQPNFEGASKAAWLGGGKQLYIQGFMSFPENVLREMTVDRVKTMALTKEQMISIILFRSDFEDQIDWSVDSEKVA